MSQEERKHQEENMKRLLEISKPKRQTAKFEAHPYIEGR
jgi:hypothetical protein